MPAKRKATRKKAPQKKTQPLPGWIWMLTGLGIGLSATFLPELLNRQTEPVISQPTAASDTERDFTFYTLLPELEVVVTPPSDANKHTAKKHTSADKKHQPAENTLFYLQAGSFKNDADADSLKAQLAMIGVETNIEVVNVNNINWHRVRVGPSHNLDQLQSIQERLRGQKIDAILLKARD